MPKNEFTRKMNDFDTFTKLLKYVAHLGKIIVATSFEWLPKVQKNRQIWSLCCQSTILRCFSSTRRSFSIFCFVVIFIQKKNICSFYEDQAR